MSDTESEQENEVFFRDGQDGQNRERPTFTDSEEEDQHEGETQERDRQGRRNGGRVHHEDSGMAKEIQNLQLMTGEMVNALNGITNVVTDLQKNQEAIHSRQAEQNASFPSQPQNLSSEHRNNNYARENGGFGDLFFLW